MGIKVFSITNNRVSFDYLGFHFDLDFENNTYTGGAGPVSYTYTEATKDANGNIISPATITTTLTDNIKGIQGPLSVTQIWDNGAAGDIVQAQIARGIGSSDCKAAFNIKPAPDYSSQVPKLSLDAGTLCGSTFDSRWHTDVTGVTAMKAIGVPENTLKSLNPDNPESYINKNWDNCCSFNDVTDPSLPNQLAEQAIPISSTMVAGDDPTAIAQAAANASARQQLVSEWESILSELQGSGQVLEPMIWGQA